MSYLGNFSKSIRIRIFLLSLIVVTPVTILVFFFNIRGFNQEQKAETDKLSVIADSAAIYNSQIIEGARQLLISLSVAPQIKESPAKCESFLSSLQNKYQRYANFGVVDDKGNLVCSALSGNTSVNLSNRYFFQQLTRTKDFSVGEYNISPLTGNAVLNFGYPLSSPYGAVYATLDLNWLNQFVSDLKLDNNVVVLVLDKQGVVLARTPQVDGLIGKSFPSDPLISNLQNQSGITETSGIDGIDRIYSYERIGLTEGGPYIVAGIAKSAILSQVYKNFLNYSLLSLFMIIITVAVSWQVSRMIVLRVEENFKGIEQLKRDFVSLVTHDLRTPLTAIKYFDQILLSMEPGKLNKKQSEFIGDSLSATNRLIFLVGTLLNISKLESGKIVPNKTKIKTNELVNNSLKLLSALIKEKHLGIKIKISRNLNMYADSKLIDEVISNLLSNAVKYSNAKTNIDISLYKKNKEIIFEVKNHGLPIPTLERIHLFTKFYRGEKAKKSDSEGSGLGLYLCKLIVEAHGGKIGFKSNLKTGTVFYFAIPEK